MVSVDVKHLDYFAPRASTVAILGKTSGQGWRMYVTLQTSLSGTFLQTLPELLTPLKGHVLFISAQLSTDAVSALRKVWVLILNKTVEATLRPSTRLNLRRVRPGLKKKEKKKRKKQFRLDSNDLDFICADVSNVGGFERNA